MGKIITNCILTITVVCSGLFFFMKGKDSTVFYGDGLGYYLYLPSAFIYHNNGNPEALPKNKGIGEGIHYYVADMKAQLPVTAKGYRVNQYTYGVAFFELPFFATAHLFEKLTYKEANGFSATYSNAIRTGGIVYLLLGLIFLFYSLLEFVTRNTALITTCLVLIGTNLFWFSFYQSGMAHVLLFFLYALLLFLTIRLHQQARPVFFLLIGLAAGFITVIRPTDVLCLLIPLLYGINSAELRKKKMQMIQANGFAAIFSAVFFALPIIPQLLYWKQLSGSFLYDSYAGQSFNFLHPKIIAGLFGFKNGWLAYTPVMLFGLIGLFFHRYFKKLLPVLLIILPLYIYIIYCWWSYNYINGFGSRPMIHLYPLLAVPFAACMQVIATKQKSLQFLIGAAILFCCYVNIKQSVQQTNGDLWSEDSNVAFNLQTLFRTNLNYNDLVVMDTGEKQPGNSFTGSPIFKQELLFTDSANQTDFIRMNGSDEFSPKSLQFNTTAKDLSAKWIKVSGLFNAPEQIFDWYQYHLLVVTVTRRDQLLHWQSVKINNKIGLADSSCILHKRIHLRHSDPEQWGTVHFFTALPIPLQPGDEIKSYVWNMARKPLLVKQLRIELIKQGQ